MVWRPSREVVSMGWTRKTRRATQRHRRPDLETLESRKLLTLGMANVGAQYGQAEVAPLSSRPSLSPAGAASSGDPGSSGDVIGAALTRQIYGVDGTGKTVAVIDTGVNYQHEALGSG